MRNAQPIVVTSGTARELMEYLQANANGGRFTLVQEPDEEALPTLSLDEEEKLLDELAMMGKDIRIDPTITHRREDIYFDHD